MDTLVQPADEDEGDPVALPEYLTSVESRRESFKTIGWRLNKIAVELDPEAKQIVDNWDGTNQDPFVCIGTGHPEAEVFSNKLSHASNTLSASWNTRAILWRGQKYALRVRGYHVLKANSELGGYELNTDVKLPDSLPHWLDKQIYWSANLDWIPVHY